MERQINTILIVEDEVITGMDIHRSLTRHGYIVFPVVAEGVRVLDAVAEFHPDLILMDIQLRGQLDGIAVAHSIGESSKIPVIFLTANTDEATFQRAKLTAPYGFIVKPFEDRELYTAVETALYRSRLEQRLHESQGRCTSLYHSTPAMLYSIAPDGKIVDVNNYWLEKMEYRRDEVIGKNFTEFMSEESRLSARKRNRNEFRDGKSSNIPYQFITKYGRSIDVLWWATPEKDDTNALRGASVVMQDVTESVRVEQTLANERNLFATIIEAIPFSIYAKNTHGRFVIANTHTVNALHVASKEDILGKTDDDVLPLSQALQNRNAEEEILHCGRPMLCVDFVRRNGIDGTIEHCEQVSKVPYYSAAGKIAGIIGINRDVTEQKRTEETLRNSEERYRLLFEESKDALFILARNGRFIDINISGVRMLGFTMKEDVKAIFAITEIFTETLAFREILGEILRRGSIQDYEIILKKKDGKPIITLVTATTVRDARNMITGFRGFVRDITAQRRIEMQLMHAQKLESIGTLAGGIAHDFNNVLAMILGAAELMKLSASDATKVNRYCDMIAEATQRGTSIAKQLLLFARSEQMDMNVVSIPTLLDEIVLLMEHTLPKTILIRTHYSLTNAWVMGDSGYLHQVLLNLAINAKDAMPAGGTITFTVSTIDGVAVRKLFPNASEGHYITIFVHDNGSGMDAATRSRIFEPFFSTKERGKGTGLGLAMVHGIVKSHNGFIDVASTPGEGTTFMLYFPSANEGESPDASLFDDGNIGGKETILIVDDEQFIRETVAEILRESGYCVIEAPNGVTALQIYMAQKKEISLVITDLGMPGISGEELFVKLQEVNPSIKAIVSTGYLEHLTKKDMLKMGVLEVIEKPFNIVALLAAVRSALDAAPATIRRSSV